MTNERLSHFARMLETGEDFSDRERGELAEYLRYLCRPLNPAVNVCQGCHRPVSECACAAEGWEKFYALRKQVAEQKYPGMTEPVRAHEPAAKLAKLAGLSPDTMAPDGSLQENRGVPR